MISAQQCIIVLPCYNEERALPVLIPELLQYVPNILVVDDGSTDGTPNAALARGARVLTLPENQGKGSALRQGLTQARQGGYKWALILDGDGQHSATDIPAFFAQADATDADLVIGNRMTQCQDMPSVRRWTNRLLSHLISLLVGQSLPDTQCGFRLLRLDALAGLNLTTTGFEIESEILTQMALSGRRISFVPIATIYKGEQSKIHPVRDAWRWIRWWYSARQTGRPVPSAEALKPSQV